ncbi:MAG: metallophosphoesterase, partial [Myxococcales bacterium]|nr:metallophosphoesterase [Myxococcales bacterium]
LDLAPVDAAPPVDAEADAALKPDAAPRDAAPPEPDAAPPAAEPILLIALGDTGKGNAGQHRVAEAAADFCRSRGGCDFALLNGDNIYESGVDGVDDPQWVEKFEAPYAALDLPFYAALGNHDYGAPPILQDFAAGIGIDPTRGQAQIDYAASQDKFRMPAAFYRFQEGAAEIVALDTATLFWRDLPFIEAITGFAETNLAQEQTLPQWAAQPLAGWRIAFGHHPYLSNGRHGNAGMYDGVFLEGLIGSGTGVRDFLEAHVLGQFDVYICGHDHNLQDLGEVEGTTLIVSGAGASTTDLRDQWLRNEAVWEVDDMGFFALTITEDSLTIEGLVVPDGGDAAPLWQAAHTRVLRR